MTEYVAIFLVLVVVSASGFMRVTPRNDDKFNEQCTKDNGVVIKADKLFCVKQSAVLEQKK